MPPVKSLHHKEINYVQYQSLGAAEASFASAQDYLHLSNASGDVKVKGSRLKIQDLKCNT